MAGATGCWIQRRFTTGVESPGRTLGASAWSTVAAAPRVRPITGTVSTRSGTLVWHPENIPRCRTRTRAGSIRSALTAESTSPGATSMMRRTTHRTGAVAAVTGTTIATLDPGWLTARTFGASAVSHPTRSYPQSDVPNLNRAKFGTEPRADAAPIALNSAEARTDRRPYEADSRDDTTFSFVEDRTPSAGSSGAHDAGCVHGGGRRGSGGRARS